MAMLALVYELYTLDIPFKPVMQSRISPPVGFAPGPMLKDV